MYFTIPYLTRRLRCCSNVRATVQYPCAGKWPLQQELIADPLGRVEWLGGWWGGKATPACTFNFDSTRCRPLLENTLVVPYSNWPRGLVHEGFWRVRSARRTSKRI